MVVPYSPEYRVTGIDLPFLRELARITGGDQLTEPIAVFLHDLESNAMTREIWQLLLLIVALLFPLDVAIRRLMIGRIDYMKAANWVQSRVNWRKTFSVRGSVRDSQMDGLFAARERARQRQERSNKLQHTNQEKQNKDFERSDSTDSQAKTTPEISFENHTEETISRLKDAKKRAQRKE